MGCAGSSPKGEDNQAAQAGGGGGGDEGEEDYSPLTQDEVNARIMCSEKALLFPLGKTGVTLRYAYLSQRGYYPEDLYKANQDAFKVIETFDGKPEQLFLGVFDGHGVDGDSCSYFVRDNIEAELKKQMKIYPDDFEKAYKEAFVGVNLRMHDQDFDDSMSGTTAIGAFFVNTSFTIANIGDSRAIVGEKKGKRVIAYSLSIDQTPYRADERERVKAAGAVVMSCDQLEGIVPYHENWGVNLGEELDNGGDPPRVWAPGKSFPGCAFTRSIGDSVAESIGVTAEPELLRKELTEEDQFVCLASDGVWEFLTNQSVCDMIMKFTDPLDACRSVVAESYRLWLQYEVRTDDITMILAFVDLAKNADGSAPDSMRNQKGSRRGSADQISVGHDIVGRPGGENRPVRRGLSKEKKQQMSIAAAQMAEEDLSDWVMEKVPKNPEQLARIKAAVKANFLFQHLNDSQSQLVYDVMKRVEVQKNDVVIRQGDQGDWFYVVDEGEYTVTQTLNGKEVEILKYSTVGGNNPCFGELALMYGKPRAATVKATTAGVLWAMDRKSFRSILMKSSSVSLTRTLRTVDVLKSLSVGQLQRLQDLLSEVTYKADEYVIKQGESSENLYIIADGRVRITKKEGDKEKHVMDLGAGTYFGERALLNSEPRAASVIASTQVKLLYISKEAFEEVLGSLQEIIDYDRQTREGIAHKKALAQEQEGLANVTVQSLSEAIEGVSCSSEPFQYTLCKLKGREYTIKVGSKAKVVDLGMQSRVMAEKELVTSLVQNHRMVPLALVTLQDDNCLYTVFKNRVCVDLGTLMGEQGFDEKTAMFYTGCVCLALDHLRSDHSRIIYRNVTTDSIVIDDKGYAQLMDMRYAVKVDSAPVDFCGYPHYLSPEQVSGQGHGFAADFWALGILTYEMCCGGANPWLTGDPAKDGEVGVYARITAHTPGSLKFPEGGTPPSAPLVEVLNDLLHPIPGSRLGERGVGPKEVRQAKWFAGFNWEKLEAGKMDAPHAKQAKDALNTALKAKTKPAGMSDKFSGEPSLFSGFSSLFEK
mmetsp:Transcript_17789/g.45577  ORF Transcript_17789/g.45577 Transcript_17789/m.45577 type:complete len:1043 (-) Transcript_17789:686-3814(-)